jgi:hypothetical protein
VKPYAVEGYGDVLRHGRCHQHLTGREHQVREPFPTPDIELGKHVVEDQYRICIGT